MAQKFRAGFTYVAKRGAYWYIIQQSGQRSWEAIVFSHVGVHNDDAYLHGNATVLRTMFDEVKMFNSNKHLRVAMFNILQTGRIDGGE